MKFFRIGATAFMLWGLAHLVGGSMLLMAASESADAFATMLSGSNTELPSIPVVIRVFEYHAFNIAWIGLLVLLVAVFLVWRNNAVGFWINLALVGFADLGLLIFMVRPGIVSMTEASIGFGLFALALVFSWQGLRQVAA